MIFYESPATTIDVVSTMNIDVFLALVATMVINAFMVMVSTMVMNAAKNFLYCQGQSFNKSN